MLPCDPQHTHTHTLWPRTYLLLQIRVVVGTDDPDIAGIDGGAFLEYLQRQEEEAQQGANSVKLCVLQPRVAVIGHTFKPIPASLEAPELSVLGKPLPAVRQEAASAIVTPTYTNIQSSSVQGSDLRPLLFAQFRSVPFCWDLQDVVHTLQCARLCERAFRALHAHRCLLCSCIKLSAGTFDKTDTYLGKTGPLSPV